MKYTLLIKGLGTYVILSSSNRSELLQALSSLRSVASSVVGPSSRAPKKYGTIFFFKLYIGRNGCPSTDKIIRWLDQRGWDGHVHTINVDVIDGFDLLFPILGS